MVKVLVLLDILVTVAQSVQKFVSILMEVNVLSSQILDACNGVMSGQIEP